MKTKKPRCRVVAKPPFRPMLEIPRRRSPTGTFGRRNFKIKFKNIMRLPEKADIEGTLSKLKHREEVKDLLVPRKIVQKIAKHVAIRDTFSVKTAGSTLCSAVSSNGF